MEGRILGANIVTGLVGLGTLVEVTQCWRAGSKWSLRSYWAYTGPVPCRSSWVWGAWSIATTAGSVLLNLLQ